MWDTFWGTSPWTRLRRRWACTQPRNWRSTCRYPAWSSFLVVAVDFLLPPSASRQQPASRQRQSTFDEEEPWWQSSYSCLPSFMREKTQQHCATWWSSLCFDDLCQKYCVLKGTLCPNNNTTHYLYKLIVWREPTRCTQSFVSVVTMETPRTVQELTKTLVSMVPTFQQLLPWQYPVTRVSLCVAATL